MSLGMHKRGCFHDVVSALNCQIVDADYRRILEWTLKAAIDSGMPYYHRMRHTGFFRHLLVRKAVKTGEILIDLITASGNDAGNPISSVAAERMLKGWKDQLLRLPLDGKIVGILHTVNDNIADAVKDEGTQVLFGQDYFYEE